MPNSGIAEDAAEDAAGGTADGVAGGAAGGMGDRCLRMRPGVPGGPGRRVGSV